MSFIDLFAKGQHSSVRVRLKSSVHRSPELQMNATNSRFSAEHLAFRKESGLSEEYIYRLVRLIPWQPDVLQ